MEATILSSELLMEATHFKFQPPDLPTYWPTESPFWLVLQEKIRGCPYFVSQFWDFSDPPPPPRHRQSVWACHEASILEFWSLEKAWMWNGSMAVQWDWYNREPTNACWNHCPPSLSLPAMREKNGSSVGCLPTRPVQSVGSWGGPIQNQIIKEIKTNDLLLEQLNLSCEEERPVWYILIPQ